MDGLRSPDMRVRAVRNTKALLDRVAELEARITIVADGLAGDRAATGEDAVELLRQVLPPEEPTAIPEPPGIDIPMTKGDIW